MERIKERGKTYALHKASDKLNDYYGNAMLNVIQFDGHDIQRAYVDGCLQTKQDFEVKDADLEKETTEFVQTKEFVESKESPVLLIAKHFYELGLKTQKGK